MSVDGLGSALQYLLRVDTLVDIDSVGLGIFSLTAVREGAIVPSTDIFAVQCYRWLSWCYFVCVFDYCNRRPTQWASSSAGDGAEGRGADLQPRRDLQVLGRREDGDVRILKGGG